MKRISLSIALLALVGAVFALGLHEHLSVERLHESHETFERWYDQHPWLAMGGYVALFSAITLFLPFATPMTVLGGALFGFWKGALLASFAAAAAAILGFLLSRFVLHDAIQRQFGERLAAVNAGMEKDGPFYLFSMRLVPVIPFFAINLAMGLTRIRTLTFYWVTQLGMLAGILIYANAGTQLAEVEHMSDVLSPDLLGSLALLGVFPLVAKKLVGLLRRRLGPT